MLLKNTIKGFWAYWKPTTVGSPTSEETYHCGNVTSTDSVYPAGTRRPSVNTGLARGWVYQITRVSAASPGTRVRVWHTLVDLDRAKRNAKIEKAENSKLAMSKIPWDLRHGQIWQLKMLLKKTIKTNVGLSDGKFTFEPSGLVIYFLRDFQ